MAYKYFGRLAGSTLATDAVTLTSPPNTTTPFTAVLPASKFIAYGENATSAAFNRALTALSVNTDALAGVLDSPALRYEVLEPSLQAGNPGYSSLAGVAAGAQKLDLGAGAHRPVTWTYVGLHKDLLLRHMQVERIANRSDGQQLLAPSDIYVNAAAAAASSSYFPTTSYTGTSDNALALKIPGVVAVSTDLPPYGGAAAPTAVGSFDSDGCRLTNKSWEDLYARPGCLVSITGAVNNRGLYRIASLSGGNGNATSKAVLTRAYTEVTVTDGTIFNVGDLVGWRPEPSNQQNAGTPAEYVNRAYVVFKFSTGNNNQAVLYLSDLGGSEDLKIQGTAVAHKVNTTSTGTVSISRYGLVDLESGATQNASFVIGTYLLNLATVGANPIANHSSTINAILPANHPVRFDTTAAAYNATVCAPPGYVLNPVVELSSNSLGGDFKIHAQVLTTAGENLRSGAGTASKGSFVPSTRFELSPGYQSLMEGLFSWIHRGDDGGTGAGPQVSRFASTRQVLGEGLWYLAFQQNLPSIPAGTVIQIVPQPNATAYNATVVRVSGTSLWIKHVYLDGKQYGNGHPAIAAGGTLTYGNPATTYTVVAVWEPRLESTPGLYVPDEGLNAQYHNHYSANPNIRGNQGLGNRIYSVGNRPLTTVMPSLGNTEVGLQVESDRRGNAQFYTVLRSGAVGMVGNLDMAFEVLGGTTLRIKDGNTVGSGGIPFSSANDTTLDPYLNSLPTPHFSLVGAANLTAGNIKTFDRLFSKALLSSPDGFVTNNLNLTIGASAYVGVGGEYQLVGSATIAVDPNSTRVIRWTGTGYVAGIGPALSGEIPIALVTTNANAFTSIVDLRIRNENLDQKLDLHVGGYGAHFSTVADAVKFVSSVGGASNDHASRRWRILVRGNVTETSTVTFSSSAPGITIEGFGEGATIEWGAADTLFSLNAADDLVFRNLHLRYNNAQAAQATTTTQRAVFRNSGGNSDNVLIDNVQVSAQQVNRLSCYGVFTSVSRLTIRDCTFEGATDVGFLFTACTQLLLDRSQVIGSVLPQAAAGPYYGITLDGTVGADDAVVRNCYIYTWRSFGIRLLVGDNVKIQNCHVHLIGGTGTEWALGIDVQPGLAPERITVSDCFVEAIATTGTGEALGIRMGGTRSDVRNNHVRTLATANTTRTGYLVDGARVAVLGNEYTTSNSAATEYGIRVTGTNCIIDANQAGGEGITVSGANNSLGAMNRDDA